jgi:hypothetical protein
LTASRISQDFKREIATSISILNPIGQPMPGTPDSNGSRHLGLPLAAKCPELENLLNFLLFRRYHDGL